MGSKKSAGLVRAALACAATVGLGLQGCNLPPPARPASTTRLYAQDQLGGARVCTVPKVTPPAPGREITVTMGVGNDGGWCGITLENDARAFDAGLVTARPAHGHPFVHTVGDATRIDYTPNPGYVGPDSFTVRLLPGGGLVRLTVTVSK